MNDLFNFLKDLFRGEAEVIAAFVVGIVVAIVFLSYLLYLLLGSFYSKRIEGLEADLKKAKEGHSELRDQLKDAQQEQADLKKKAKDRKERLDAFEREQPDRNKELGAAKQEIQKLQNNESALRDQLKMVLGKNKRLYANAQEKLRSFIGQTTSLKKQVASLNDQMKLIEQLQGQLWEAPVDKAKVTPFRPLKKSNAVIIALTNLKGGVGKTTLTANLAITYCREMGRRVLMIDLDIQASLTNLCMPADLVGELQIGNGRLIDNVFKDLTADVATLAFSNITQTREPKLHLLAASGHLANVEEQAKARWLMNYDKADVRSVLRAALHNPVFQDNFDVILIDCPPRWTTSSINAVACCDYVLIPTQLDRLSSEAVPRLLAWLRDLRGSSVDLFGSFEILGVVGNRVYPRETLIAQEREIWQGLPAKCQKAWLVPVHHFGTMVKDKSEFRRAANSREFAALHPDLQPTFLQLVQEIEARRSEHEGR